jgi:hypothetical protein
MKRLMGIFNPYALKRYEALGQRESDGSFVRTQADSAVFQQGLDVQNDR